MLCAVIYHNEDNKRTWIKCVDLSEAEKLSASIRGSEVYIPLCAYRRLQYEVNNIRNTLAEIREICGD